MASTHAEGSLSTSQLQGSILSLVSLILFLQIQNALVNPAVGSCTKLQIFIVQEKKKKLKG